MKVIGPTEGAATPPVSPQERQTKWRPISEAPRDGTRIRGKGPLRLRVSQMPGSILAGSRTRVAERVTFWGKTSHVPLYGWNWGRDPEDQNLWEPTHWCPL
jgi:hypothetical protein